MVAFGAGAVNVVSMKPLVRLWLNGVSCVERYVFGAEAMRGPIKRMSTCD
jgi:hypothetical protein